jgi:glyoxylase-like metal-dependent hydrolase (beta-lactamase superfamily II)
MRVHHLNCATLCPPSARLVSGEGSWVAPGRLVCHCLLVEIGGELALVDTGLGLADIARAGERLGWGFLGMLRPRLDPSETAVRQVERLGLRPEDVRHIVITHLDPDHAGGIADFPEARVHLLRPERDAALWPRTSRERGRYRARQWSHAPRWIPYEARGEPWFGFECVRGLDGLPPDILLVPLVGHTRGHAGVAVRTETGWLLHAGDAYFHRGQMARQPHAPLALRLVELVDDHDRSARARNQERLRRLVQERRTEVQVFCAHDPVELAAFEARAESPRRRAAG